MAQPEENPGWHVALSLPRGTDGAERWRSEERKQKTAYEMNLCDWSSDVCSSDLSSVMVPPVVTLPVSSIEKVVSVAMVYPSGATVSRSVCLGV